MSFLDRYYAIWDGEAYLETAFNATSRFSAKEALLSLIEPETDEHDFKKYLSMDVDEICKIKGWTFERSQTPFKTTFRGAFDSPDEKFRVEVALTTYCYIDVIATSVEDAKAIASRKHKDDFYTMGGCPESEDKIEIIDAKLIS